MNKFINQNLSGGETEFFKVKEGQNKIRILTTPESYFNRYDYKNKKNYNDFEYFQGASNRFMVYVLDYAETDEKSRIKIYEMPVTVAKQVQALAKDEDYEFTDFPMPYDIKINAVGAGSKEVVYSVTPSPKLSEISKEVLEEVAGKKSCAEIVKAKVEKSRKMIQAEEEIVGKDNFAEVPEDKKKRGGPTNMGKDEDLDYGDSINPEDIPF